MAQEMGEPASDKLISEAKSTTTEIAKFKPVTAKPASSIAEYPVQMALETGESASDKSESEVTSAPTGIV